MSSYVYAPYPTAIFVSTSVNEKERMKENPLVENAVLPHTETRKLAHLFILN